jgi:hypothetical protein
MGAATIKGDNEPKWSVWVGFCKNVTVAILVERMI